MTTPAIPIRSTFTITPPPSNPLRAARARAEGDRRRARAKVRRARKQEEKRDE
jgi:hypothetical protein